MLQKMKYYTLKHILSKNAQYNVIFGERSNGKTYSVLDYGLKEYCQNGAQLAVVRRWQDDFRGKRGSTMFDNLVSNGLVKQYTNDEWTNIYYYGGKWYLCRFEKNKRVIAENPFAYAFALSANEHDKSTSYPNVKNVLFDEFLTRGMYLPDEFVLFMNVLSTIIRNRDDVKIFMCGNTVNQYSPYFTEMGLTHIKQMNKGDIDIYNYGESGLKVAVEFSDSPSKNKPSDLYFAFNNPKLNMITGKNCIWEMNIYPHCPYRFKPRDIKFIFFIEFNNDMLQCEVVNYSSSLFIYIHRKSTPLKNPDGDLIYSVDYDPRPNWRRKITKPYTIAEKKIANLFIADKIFYQDNEVGEIVRNYIVWCKTDRSV